MWIIATLATTQNWPKKSMEVSEELNQKNRKKMWVWFVAATHSNFGSMLYFALRYGFGNICMHFFFWSFCGDGCVCVWVLHLIQWCGTALQLQQLMIPKSCSEFTGEFFLFCLNSLGSKLGVMLFLHLECLWSAPQVWVIIIIIPLWICNNTM